MKRLLDIPIVCVSAVLIVALLRTPTAAPPSVDDHVMNRPAASPAVDGERDQAAGRRHASAAQSTEAEKGSETADRSVQLSDLASAVPSTGAPPVPGAGEVCETILMQPPQLLSEPQFSPGFLDVCLRVAEDINVELASKLRVLRKKRPAEFELRLRRSPRLIEMALLKQRDPNLYDLKLHEISAAAEVKRLANEISDVIADERTDELESLKEQLRMQLRIQMGVQLKARQDYLCAIQELAQQLEAELQRDQENFDENVERRLQWIIDEAKRDVASGDKGPPE